ncbi:hypothetical protein [Clostridium sp. BJN0013]|uniref:hypothetical protein n=1 Tax=Clostridium sp. BJN0013 TaxID=3236840 RepID=UPI0034C64CF8
MKIERIFTDKEIEPFLDELESLINKYEYFLIDIFPKKILDADKFSQYEIVYDSLIDDKNQSSFLVNENKFINLLKKIWLYNKTKAFVFECNCENLFKNSDDIKYFKSIKDSENETKLINNVYELELLIKLGMREKLYSILVFEDMEIICWLGNGLNCSLYSNKEGSMGLMEKMATTEGLYLYKCNNN